MPIYAKSADHNGYKEPLGEHTLKDLKAGHAIVANLPFGKDKNKRIGSDLDLIILGHDLGKAATGFQASLEKDAPRWGRRHEILSAVAALSTGVKDVIAFDIITHHKTLPADVVNIYGCLPDVQLPYRDHIFPIWQKMAEEWNENIIPLTEEWIKICKAVGREDLLSKRLNLDTILSDNLMNWLSRDNQTECFSFKEREYASLLRGLTMKADHIMSAGDYIPMDIPRFNTYNNITPKSAYGFQIRAGKKLGNLILRAPTGCGKTEAALMWAQLNQKYNGRLFYTLPSTASLNAMYLRLKETFNDINSKLIGLLHSRVVSSIYSMLEDESSYKNQDRAFTLSSLAREMYFPIRICTPHQIMKLALQGKGWELMLSEFPNSCFIFDEIHAYNPKHVGITMATVKYIVSKNGTCMFLSATLPKFLRKIIRHEIPEISFMQPSYNNVSDRRILEQKRHILESVDGNILDNIDLIVREADKAKSTLVICNHVATAQQVYRELVKKVKDTVLLHSQFARRDRNKVENELIKRLPKVLVSTQVVEISLNLDFEQGFTEPAPIDAIVQRMGRINRYAAQTQPVKVRIFTKQLNKDNKTYSEELRDKSLRVLSALPTPLGEEDLNLAADRIYGKGYSGDKLTDYQEGLDCVNIKNIIAGTHRDWLEDIIKDDEGAIEVLPEQFLNEYDSKKEQGLIIKAFGMTVPVGKWRLKYLFDQHRIDKSHDPWILNDCRYSKEVGLEIDNERSSSVVI
jgi:CRISPR-associated endonuclease/helicase Cas3